MTYRIGFLLGKGYFIYTESMRNRISVFFDEQGQAAHFGERLAVATLGEFNGNVGMAEPTDLKKVLSIKDMNAEQALSMYEDITQDKADAVLEQIRTGATTVQQEDCYKYTGGIDFN